MCVGPTKIEAKTRKIFGLDLVWFDSAQFDAGWFVMDWFASSKTSSLSTLMTQIFRPKKKQIMTQFLFFNEKLTQNKKFILKKKV